MVRCAKLIVLVVLLVLGTMGDSRADKRTVCTITVNSPDEREMFRRNLPNEDFDFVELVERGRPDWLASACHKGVRCDVLLISGHFDDGTEFYSDRLDAREYLPVDEMERAACSDSCPGLFSQLKEVYLFGCNTLNAEALRSTSAEIVRSLVRSGHSRADAEQFAQVLDERHGESNRDRMRYIFKDVPVIYGFSSKAPLGASAAALLDRYFQSGAGTEVASGRASPTLLSLFANASMTRTAGLDDADPQAGHRRDVCQFADDRLSTAQKLDFVHQLMGREMAEVRMFLDRIEKEASSITPTARETPEVTAALDAIARDKAARDRYLDLARDADQLSTSVRMLDIARTVGWLSPADQEAELMRRIGAQIARNAIGVEDVDLVCRLNQDGQLERAAARIEASFTPEEQIGPAAALACLGSSLGRQRVLRALTSTNDDDVRIAQVYLRHRPIADVNELRQLTAGIARMNGLVGQVRALDTLAGHRPSDRESIEALTRLFSRTKSLDVQRAIAGVLIRSDYEAMAKPELVRALQQYRLRSPGGADLIDVLIRRLQASS